MTVGTAVTDAHLAARENPGEVWRVGYATEPWQWTDWKHAHRGTFSGRWDSPDGAYRTLYVGTSLFAALVEVLAPFRPDPAVVSVLADINVDEADRALHPTVTVGTVDEGWFEARRAGSATLSGRYCDVAAAATIASLRPVFLAEARRSGLADFDASTLHNSEPRSLTQDVAAHVYALTTPARQPMFDGVRFLSRHGADLELWAIFERASDTAVSGRLSDLETSMLRPDHPDVQATLALHGLELELD